MQRSPKLDASMSTDPKSMPSLDLAAMISPDLHPWDKGTAVMELQELLRAHGFTIRVDGDFGGLTETAVRLFQRQHRLRVDGIVDAKTWIALKTHIQAGTRILKLGHTGSDVYELQGLLRIHSYSVPRNGVFNEATQEAVIAFQQRYHLRDDGIVNPTTWTALRGKGTLPQPPQQSNWFNFRRWW
jgi:peptidoglycan hydrolase-like protein with peptidoglycan-binding domain